MDTVNELLTRGVENIIPNKEKLKELLSSGKKLNIYLGIDPTATNIHLGHAVPLRKLQQFAELGHNVTFLIGDFTALIGDTSDKESERPVLTKDQIEQNFQTYKKQAEKLLDFTKITVRHNSQWLSTLSYAEIITLMQHFSAGDFFSRELIKKRLMDKKHVGLHEIMYPVMQGYDSYFLDTDIQLGGTDQTFNMQAGRILQKNLRQKESFIICNGFLTGTDGRKMSKTWNNAVWLTDQPNDMFGKIMSLKDELIIEYFKLATNLPMEQITKYELRMTNKENPMIMKKELATLIVSELHSPSKAEEAKNDFETRFQKKELAQSDLPVVPIGTLMNTCSIVDTVRILKLSESNSSARRLVEQGAVFLNDRKIQDPKEIVELKPHDIVKVGRKAVKIGV